MEVLEEIAAVEIDSLAGPTSIQRVLEGNGITPEVSPLQPQLLIGGIDQRVPSERAPKEVHRLAQSVARVLSVVLRPEQDEKRITTVRPARESQRQVRKQGGALGLRENGAKVRPALEKAIGRPARRVAGVKPQCGARDEKAHLLDRVHGSAANRCARMPTRRGSDRARHAMGSRWRDARVR